MATGQTASKIHDMLDPEGRLLLEVLQQTKTFIRDHTYPRIEIDMTTGEPVYSCPWCENVLSAEDIRVVEVAHTENPSTYWDADDKIIVFSQDNRSQVFDSNRDGSLNYDRKWEDDSSPRRWEDLHLFHKGCGYPVSPPLNWSVAWED
jgi:hypothetical protein